MKIQKLDTVDAFVVFDLEDAEASVGAVRLAPKILRGGAKTMARSLTYQFASFGLKVGGASVGINAHKEKKSEAIAAFVEEASPLVRQRRLLVDPGRGVDPDGLAELRDLDARSPMYWTEGPRLTALGIVHSALAAVDSMAGLTVAIEGFDALGPDIAESLSLLGAKILSLGTPMGTVVDPAGIPTGALREAWGEHGPGLVDHIGGDVRSPGAITEVHADMFFVGSKLGILDHVEAARMNTRVVIPTGPAPVTAKARATLRKAEVTVLPDFITTAGALFAAFPPEGRTPDELDETVVRRITEAVREVIGHPAGPYLGACERAEEFLSTWQETLPFGRPLA